MSKSTRRGPEVPLGSGQVLSGDEAFGGISVTGGVGSGKTTRTGATIRDAMLRQHLGGLVLVAKPDVLDDWMDAGRACNRQQDIVVVSCDHEACTNLIEFEFEQADEETCTHDLFAYLLTVLDGGQDRGAYTDRYWGDFLQDLVINSIDLVIMSGTRLSLDALVRVARGFPTDASAADSSRQYVERRQLDGKPPSVVADLILRASVRQRDAYRQRDLALTTEYFLDVLPTMDARVRSNGISSFTTRATPLLRSPFNRLIGDRTTLRPSECRQGKIIVLNMPIKRFGEAGRMMQMMYKTAFQREMERHPDSGRPVFLFADEAHYFATRNDVLFAQTARSAGVVQVLMTQSIANFHEQFGGGPLASTRAEIALGLMATKIFLNNGCPTNNEWASRCFGTTLTINPSVNAGDLAGMTVGFTPQVLPAVAPGEFLSLAQDDTSEALVLKSGRDWGNGQAYLRTRFAAPRNA